MSFARTALIYDADCRFCKVATALALTWDRRGRLLPVPLTDPAAAALLPGVSAERRAASWHVAGANAYASGGAAFAPLLGELPGGRPLAVLAGRLPRLSDRLYRAVADRRSQLSPVMPGRLVAWADAVIARRTAT